MKLTDIIKKNKELESDFSGEEFKIAVISNVTINLLKPVLELALREEGVNAVIEIGDYDSIIQDSKRFSQSKVVIVFWELGNLIDGLHTHDLSIQKSNELISKMRTEIDFVMNNLNECSLVLFNRFSSLVFDSSVLKESTLRKIGKNLNENLEKKISRNTILVDLEKIIADVSITDAHDARSFISAKSLYSLQFYKSYVRQIMPAFGGIIGKVKKVLILDCDNTLWGGILGEDGFDSIQMSESTPKGKAFREVQRLFLNFKNSGVLLALCSKNNLEDVERVINDHPDFLFKDEDLIAKKVNWSDKATNIKQLAEELNLGLDSFVFIDDSEFELGLIKSELPQVKCFCVPKNISDYPTLVRDISGMFYSSTLAEEDSRKTQMYKEEITRKSSTKGFNSLSDYLESLELEMTIMWNESIPVERTAQLTQKTNQFNLTTRRYTEADIRRMLSSNYLIGSFSLADKYGDYGVTGTAIVRIEENEGRPKKGIIDTFLMSCRVLGRNVEYEFFEQINLKLLEQKVFNIETEYIPTLKNIQVKDFYSSLGMEIVESSDSHTKYRGENIVSNSIKYISTK